MQKLNRLYFTFSIWAIVFGIWGVCQISAQQTAEGITPAAQGSGSAMPANRNLPTLFLVGDSTVRKANGHGEAGLWGWGEPVADLFDTEKINVVNRALGGRSSRSYIGEGHWDDVLALLKPGDIVMIQFGHNDPYPLDDPHQARGTIAGIGDEGREIENPVLKHHEIVHTYGWYLRKYAADTIAHGATPIICSPIPQNKWVDGHITGWDDTFALWARQVAIQQHVSFVDLYAIIGARYKVLGQEAVQSLFGDHMTHTNREGAEMNAAAVVSGLKALPQDPLAGYFSVRGEAIAGYVPGAN